MVNLCRVAALAGALFASTAVSHNDHALSPRELEVRAERMRIARRGLGVCAETLQARGWEKRNVDRRAKRAAAIRAKRNLPAAPWKKTKRDFEDVLGTNHNDTLKFPGANLDTPSSVFFGEDPTQACILTAEAMVGPYYVDGELIRNDIVEDQAGVPLYVDIQVLNIETCEPVPNMYTDLWHANSTGVYSGVIAEGNGNDDIEGNLNTTFGRGVYATDAEGVVEYHTIFPGHYIGRAVHMHVMTHEGGEVLPNNTFKSSQASHVGQIYFDQALVDTVEATEPYTLNQQEDTFNADDRIMREQADTSEADPVVHYIYLGEGVTDGVFAWTTLAVNRTSVQEVIPAVHWTENGGVKNPDAPSGPPGGGMPSGGFPSGLLGALPTGLRIFSP
ncbi:hypothetical protein AJ79_02735 [Helicocarpus griseus UAMH5409]|uniref:Intradiol ring-cleavage dioxygenases domain-containing protein n=1 Tax=Helicocarpus griseus UAMH5409 TaxID=1447875 RepID=A0A2B7Y1F9_9EURO|nr:hypothetical protein AJ79_02735 [Helicocarpus griseus UAMH5409]